MALPHGYTMQQLPDISPTPKDTLVVPSTGKTHRYRPYLAGEEKLLLLAQEAGTLQAVATAVADLISACVEDISFKDLTTFDVEYIFLKIRSVSVGSTDTVALKCMNCDEPNEVTVNFDREWDLDIPEPPRVEITDTVAITLSYPKFRSLANFSGEAGMSEALAMVDACIDMVQTPTSEARFADFPEEERLKFINNIPSDKFQIIRQFIASTPKLTDDIKFTCKSCEHENSVSLQGIQSFFA